MIDDGERSVELNDNDHLHNSMIYGTDANESYQSTAMNEFILYNKRRTTDQFVCSCIFDNRHIVGAAVLHFMETACECNVIDSNYMNLLNGNFENLIYSVECILRYSIRDTSPMPVNCDNNCRNPRSKSPTCNGLTINHGSPVFTADIGGLNLVGVLLKSS